MDTSKEYIKMCEKAEEIQTTDWKNDVVYFFCPERNKTYCGCPRADWGNVVGKWITTQSIWLPRQDQLQEMVSYEECFELRFQTHYKQPYFEITRYGNIKNNFQPNSVRGKTMEQLWLAFVMFEKYNKVWNGKDWIKES